MPNFSSATNDEATRHGRRVASRGRTGEKSLAGECLRQERADVGEGVTRRVDDGDMQGLDAGAVRQTGETTIVQRLIGRGLHLDLTAEHREPDVDREVDDGHVAVGAVVEGSAADGRQGAGVTIDWDA